MSPRNKTTLVQARCEIEDPRVGNGKRHDLVEVLVIAICAIFAEVEGFVCFGPKNSFVAIDSLVLSIAIPHASRRLIISKKSPILFGGAGRIVQGRQLWPGPISICLRTL